ncbi:hypothetical protein V3C99_015181 [Haemonchus contortus]|uniref:Serpentine receptor class gamma n=1 Tax=Haemonchus contortus TaxID=6289 RepID=A0A7I4YVZ3_HAECO
MALFSLLIYIGYLASYIYGLILFDSPKLSRITGSCLSGSYFAYVIANLCLTVHRLFYTLLPLRSPFILTTTVEKICIASIILSYIVHIAITLSPLAFVRLCPAHFLFYSGLAPFRLNRLVAYVAVLVNVTAYTIMFAILFIKGSFTFKRNKEIRMTVQAALLSACELAFLLYWRYGPRAVLSWGRILNNYTKLIYYDVHILPYVIINKTVRTEMKKLFRKQKSRTSIVASLDRSRSTLRQRQGV